MIARSPRGDSIANIREVGLSTKRTWDLYQNWEVIYVQEEEGLARQKKADGTAMKNTILRMLMRK